VYTQTMQGNRGIDDLSKAALSKMVTTKDAESVVGAVKKNTAAVVAPTRTDDASDKLEASLQAAAVFSKVKALAEAMFKAGMAPTVLQCWRDVLAVEKDVPRGGDVAETFANCTSELAKSDRKNLAALVDAGVIKTVQEPLRQLTKDAPMAATLRTLRTVAAPPDFKRRVVDEGCVESCVAAMRTMVSSAVVFEPAFEALLQMCAVDELAASVANKGGTRQVLKGLQDNASNAAFERPVELGLQIIEKVRLPATATKCCRCVA
jgi:hypothetical protein